MVWRSVRLLFLRFYNPSCFGKANVAAVLQGSIYRQRIRNIIAKSSTD